MGFKPNYTHCSSLFLLKCFIFSFCSLKCFCYSVGFGLAPNVFGAQRPNRRAQRSSAWAQSARVILLSAQRPMYCHQAKNVRAMHNRKNKNAKSWG